jgi:lipopolysaccharide/colanic/teichoic acid biosynthesis glycosyltransferase
VDAVQRTSGENVRPAAPVESSGLAAPVTGATAATVPRGVAVDPRRRSEGASRLLNVVLALLLLLVALPLFALVALAVRLSSRGPVFYTQLRVGLDRRARDGRTPLDRRAEDYGGRPFTIYKFRSMYVDAEPDGRAVWARPDDPRVTPVGRVLRAARLDELPQLFNVLKGDMNLVGPRPERPSIVMELREHIAEYAARHRVKPGLTGLAQVNRAYDATIEDVRQKVHYDLEYVRRQGLWKDLVILAKTVPVVLFRRGGW